MDEEPKEVGSRVAAWAVALAASVFVAAEVWIRHAEVLPVLPTIGWLAGGAALVARLAVAGDGRGPARLALTPVLAALLALPSPSALLVGLAALLGGGGGGLAGPFRRGVVPFASSLVAVAIVQHYRIVGLPPVAPVAPVALAPLLLAFGALHGCAYALSAALRSLSSVPFPREDRSALRNLAFETVNVMLAWLLASLIVEGNAAPGIGLVLVLTLGQEGLRRLHEALRDLRDTNDSLAARVSELHTLHAIGREILSSLDPDRVFDIVERECRKVFDVDLFSIATVDRDTGELHVVYRRDPGHAPREVTRPLGEGLVSWVVTEKRAVRVDDLLEDPASLPFKPETLEGGVRAALAVPLVVEEKVVGVLSVQCARPGAYDDHLLAVLTTIAQQAAVALENARHYQMATVDSLTGLFLRDYFFRRLEEEYARSRRYDAPFTLLMIDLDAFKEINDRHGHLAGDRYLRALGTALRARLRGADLACRYGGDEFCLLLPETDLAGASAIAERLRAAISRLVVDVEGNSLRTTVSIGLAAYPDHDAGELRSLLLRADQALYAAKRAGRDRVSPFAA